MRLIPAFWCSHRSRLYSWRCCRSLWISCTWRRALLWSALGLRNPPKPSASELGIVAFIWVQQSRANRKTKRVALPGRRGSGVFQCSQIVGCAYSSHRWGQVLQNSTRVSWIHPPHPLYGPLSSWVVCGAIVDRHTLSHLQRFFSETPTTPSERKVLQTLFCV